MKIVALDLTNTY